MRILWINEHASYVGGCEQYIAQTAALLKKEGCTNALLYNTTNDVDPSFISIFDQAFPIGPLKKQLEEINPDLIYLHQYWDQDSFQILKAFPKPVVRFFHDYKLFCLRESKITTIGKHPCSIITGLPCYPCLGFLNKTEKFPGIKIKTLGQLEKERTAEHGFDAFLTASNYMRDHAIAHGFPPELTHKIPLYAPTPTFLREREKEPGLILFASQLIWGKGLDLALHALSKLKSPAKLIVAGKGKHRFTYERLSESLNIQNRVSFIGHRSGRALEELFAMATCVVHPTRYPEPFGLIGPEAMRFGTPVVASDLAGIPEWLQHEKTGLLVPPEDVESLTSALEKILSNATFAEELGKNGKESYLKNFTQDNHIESLLNLFKKIRSQPNDIPWKKCTPNGYLEAEKTIQEICNEVKEVVLNKLKPNEYKVLLLIGGYGKGEGGVEIIQEKERPHNNLDFLLVANLPKEKQSQILFQVQSIANKEKIGIDFSFIQERNLKYSRNLVIWHDLMFGHQTLLGDPYFIPSLPYGDPKKIDPWNMTELLINRGSLLIINEWLNDHEKKEEKFQKIVQKHCMKAWIGLGDAILFHVGKYNWSYEEKRKRMKSLSHLPSSFLTGYEDACAFRLTPHYSPYTPSKELHKHYQKILFQNEESRLNIKNLTLSKWWNALLKNHIKNAMLSPVLLLKRLIHLTQPSKHKLGKNTLEKMLFSLCSPQERLAMTFPVVAFNIGEEQEKKQVQEYLGAEALTPSSLRAAYLREWSRCGDINFQHSVEKWGLEL